MKREEIGITTLNAIDILRNLFKKNPKIKFFEFGIEVIGSHHAKEDFT
jgi:hypothetical protein